ncbi:uncharacterized protein EMH_0100580 [Eimeria mitis]|nr:uncharacterized protein EMH_0100580 [Eimeria mitis]CDJ35755.1 hypothetical protein, conserved [Eimeria mitis]
MIDPSGNFAAVEPTITYRLCVYTAADAAATAAVARGLTDMYRRCSSKVQQQKRAEVDEEGQEQQQQWRSDLMMLQQYEEQLLQQLSFLPLDDPDVPAAVAAAAKHVAETKHSVADSAPSAAWVEEILVSLTSVATSAAAAALLLGCRASTRRICPW